MWLRIFLVDKLACGHDYILGPLEYLHFAHKSTFPLSNKAVGPGKKIQN